MYQRVIRYAPVLLLLATAGACERAGDTPTAPTSSAGQTMMAEPLTVRPEFLRVGDCSGLQPFGVRVFISLRGRDAVVSALRFQFVDLVGARTLPDVIRLPSPGSAPTSVPSASPVTLPGIAALPPLAATSAPIPFFARFGCGVSPEGTLIITADLAGRIEEARIAVRSGSTGFSD